VVPEVAGWLIDRQDDLPTQYRGNLDVADASYDRKPGEKPALDDAEIADIIACLATLTDVYRSAAYDGP
jgi:cytochrome c peroxidase